MRAGVRRSVGPGKDIVPSTSGQLAIGRLVVDDDLGLSFYREPPSVEMSVRDFEDMTKERLKLLHIIDRVCGYDTHLAQVTDKDFKSKVATDFGIQAQFSDPTWQSFGLRQ